MSFAPIPKGGDVETTYAKIFARYGYWSNNYLGMLRGAPIPKHVIAMAESFRKSRYWEKLDEPRKISKPKGWEWMDAPKSIPKPELEGDEWWADVMEKAGPVVVPEQKPVKTNDDWWIDVMEKAKELQGK